jgi:homoserine dehydrogenase
MIILGFGTVGRCFADLLVKNSDWLRKQHGITTQLVAIVDRGGALVDQDGVDIEGALAVRKSTGSVAHHESLGRPRMDAQQVIEKVEADVLLEFTPTILPDPQPGLAHIESAIKKNLHVVTTNKGPLATAMPALLELADYQRVQFRFSGTVGGGTPFLNFAKRCLLGDRIRSIQGILNGTTNYILTRMFDAGITMKEALGEATRAGYTEADPSYDINGTDTASKLVIISNWIMGRRASISEVETEGISKITLEEVMKAKESGNAIKLVGYADESKISVHPIPVSLNNPLCVRDTLNAMVFKTDQIGELTLTGRGAGGNETAWAALKDLIDVKNTLQRSNRD